MTVSEFSQSISFYFAKRQRSGVNIKTFYRLLKLVMMTQYLQDYYVGVQITDCGQSVFPINVDTDQMDEVSLNLYKHLCSLLYQRDFYIKVTLYLCCSHFTLFAVSVLF